MARILHRVKPTDTCLDVRIWRSSRSVIGDSKTGGRHCPWADSGDCASHFTACRLHIVWGRIVEPKLRSTQITRARHLTNLRSSRFLSADDVIFLIRDDRGKVNRLRTYLSWKDVRKKAKDDESGEAGAEVDMDDAGEIFPLPGQGALRGESSALPTCSGHRFSLREDRCESAHER